METKVTFFDIRKIFIFSGFFLLALIVPFFIHSQWLTGPFVNALLLLISLFVGPAEAIAIGIIPSTAALSSGLLPLPLAPMVPFIIASNAIFILVFSFLYRKNFALGVLVAAFLKFIFLLSVSSFLVQRLIAVNWESPASLMMSWPQFVTSVLGGIIAFFIFQFSKK